MDMRPTPRPRGRVPKRLRTAEELADLAQRLGADWRPGDNVMTWIRRHEATDSELSRLVRDGWSWDDVGRALAMAGIKYQTGPAISGEVLRRKAEKARADERKRQEHGSLRRASPPLQTPPPPPKQTTVSAPETILADDEPEFRPAALKGWSGTKIDKKPQSLPEIPPHDVTTDAADVIARLLGKK